MMSDTDNLTLHKILRWSDDECRQLLEKMRWPDGVICPKCGAEKPYRIRRRSKTKNKVAVIFRCRGCKRQFSTTVGTVFEDSKIPLHKWFAAMYLMCSSKKGISAHQLHRMLDIGYQAAWFMCHRVRAAMTDDWEEPLSGVVEADETYVGPRTRRGHPTYHERIKDEEEMGLRPKTPRSSPLDGKTPVFGMIERGGGRVQTQVVPDARRDTLRPIMLRAIDLDQSMLITDGHPAYRSMRDHLTHEVIDHEVEYVRGEVHTQNIENNWSIFKRGVNGVFHHIGEDYLPMYLSEFDFRGSRRRVSDSERFLDLMGQTQGRLLWYCQTPQTENPHA